MAFSAWSGRLVAIGASPNEVAAVGAAYLGSTSSMQGALDTIIAGIGNGDLLVMLNTWRTSGGPFENGFPGGGLPFGTKVPVLTGNPSDDTFAIGAGTGIRVTPGGGSPSGAAGGKLSGTYPNPGLNAASTDLSDSALLARLASPTFTGAPAAPTPTGGDNSTRLATTAFVQSTVSFGGAVSSVFTRTGAVVASSGDYSVTQVTGAAPLASPALTGTPSAPTASALDNSTKLATTAYADSGVSVEKARALAAEGNALLKASNLSDVGDPGGSRANIRVPSLTPAQCVATANVSSLSGFQTVDGYTLVAGDLILLTAQTTASQNGLWLAASGAWSRPTEFPAVGVVKARTCAVINGTVNAATEWLLQIPTGSIVIDTGAQTWTKVGGSGSGAVSSVFGRTGVVVAGNADYLAVASGGLTGAAAATRYVGGTASGAPTSGTFAVGDFVIDQTGKIWVCTVAGSPGTWVQPGGAGGSTPQTMRTVTAATTIVSGDAGNVVELDATSAAISQPLPSAAAFAGRLSLVATTTGTNLVTLTTTGGQTVIPPGTTGVSTTTLGNPASGAAYQAVDLLPDGANWRIV